MSLGGFEKGRRRGNRLACDRMECVWEERECERVRERRERRGDVKRAFWVRLSLIFVVNRRGIFTQSSFSNFPNIKKFTYKTQNHLFRDFFLFASSNNTVFTLALNVPAISPFTVLTSTENDREIQVHTLKIGASSLERQPYRFPGCRWVKFNLNIWFLNRYSSPSLLYNRGLWS